MSLAAVVDAIAERLQVALGNGITVGDRSPVVVADLPAVTLSATDAERRLVGVGRVPRGTRRGALVVETAVDLANPVLVLGAGETLNLLSGDRRTLTLPHGPIVRADGTEDLPFSGDDVGADDGTPFAVVATPPNGRALRPDPVEGTLQFGDPLAASGTLSIRYHVGQWDVTVSRFQGDLAVDVAAVASDATADLTRDVAGVLDGSVPGVRLAPRAWGSLQGQPLGEDDARAQRLAYRFDAEVEVPVLGSSGGVITRIAARVLQPVDGGTHEETFELTREGSPV